MDWTPVIRCGWCNKPVKQPEDGAPKTFCNGTHEKNLKKQQKGKKVTPPTSDISCFGCMRKADNSKALKSVMALCIECHWMSYSMCWRKERLPRIVKYKGDEHLYQCPICLGWHWTKQNKDVVEDEVIREKREYCQRIGDYIRRLDFDRDQLRDLPPYGWGADKVA